MLPLVSLMTGGTAIGTLMYCSKSNRQPTHQSTRDGKSGKSGKAGAKKVATKGKADASKKGAKSSKSQKSQKSQRGVSAKSAKSGKSSKSAKKSKRSTSKSAKSAKSSKSKKSSSKRSSRLKVSEREKQKKMEQSAKCAKSRKATTATCQKDMKKPSGSMSEAEPSSTLQHVPNENAYAFSHSITRASTLQSKPNKLPFDPSGGYKSIHVVNDSDSRKAFKIKCSDNMLYRVHPVYGFLNGKESVKIDVLRQNGEKKTDNLIVLTTDAAEQDQDAKKMFQTEQIRELTVVPLIAA